jgi:hypothetical protein
MNLSTINSIIDSVYIESIQNPQRIFPYEISQNVTLQVDLYENNNGNGFRVACKMFDSINKTVKIRVRNYGPDVNSELVWTTYKYPIY